MTAGRMGRWVSGGLLLSAWLVTAGCSDRKPPADERAVEESPSDTRPVAAPAVPAAPPPPVRAETPPPTPPAETPSAEAQMQDDAAASGMTSQIPNIAEDTQPLASENSN